MNQFAWRPHVALAKRRMLQQLPEMVAVAAWRFDRAERFDHEQTNRAFVEPEFMDDGTRNYQVIARPEFDLAHLGEQVAAAFVHENNFVGNGIFVV